MISKNPYDSTLSFTVEEWGRMLRDAKDIGWHKGINAAAAICDEQAGLSNNPLHLAKLIRALESPYEKEKCTKL